MPIRYISDNNIYGIVERHLGTTNYLFADGHVNALKLETAVQHATSPVNTGCDKMFTIEAD